jgi:hypothetical protein
MPKLDERTQKCDTWKAKRPVMLDEYSKTEEGVNLYHFVDVLSRSMKDGSVVVSDA